MTGPETVENVAETFYQAAFSKRAASLDRMFTWLLGVEWLGLIAVAVVRSLWTWKGQLSAIHPHVWAAIGAGPCFILPAILLARLYPARPFTRHAIAIAQTLFSILLIDVTGGRIETHFHIFGSLAFLALYRDWRVLITASALTAVDHLVRGIWWPESVFGVSAISPFRWVEHTWWMAFEDFFLLISMRASNRDAGIVAANAANLYQGANHDVLTGLANRRLLAEKFQTSMTSQGALLFIDLDRFKQANDSLGHAVGDLLLQQVARRLSEVVGSAGTLARVGGDEFVVLIPDLANQGQAAALCKEVLHSLAMPFVIEGNHILLSASIGVSLYPSHGTQLGVLQEKADRAMYTAKSRGRNQCIVFTPEISRQEQIAGDMARDIASGLARNEFELLFQPLVRRDGGISGFEALMRWHHPRHGLITPADFIPMAEKSGVILRLGDWALLQACRTCRTWQQPGMPGIGIAVNVSAVQFEQDDYPERVLGALFAADLEPSLLTLELTEGVLVRDAKRARSHITRIRMAGVRLALDDFGTGYSSLSYLTELPADLIKLDRTFIDRELSGGATVLESIVSLAHRLGLKVVAEGIETMAQSDRIRDLLCDEYQGYYFSRPIPAAEVQSLLHEFAADTSGETAELIVS